MALMRNPGEPAGRPHFFAALATAQTVGPATGDVLFLVIAANSSSSVRNLAVTDGTGQITSLQVPANDTRYFNGGQTGAKYSGQLTVTPSAALDVTVVILSSSTT